jgi:hypothetical protein
MPSTSPEGPVATKLTSLMFLIKILVDYNMEIIKSTNLFNRFIAFVAFLLYRIFFKLKISMAKHK